MNPLALEESTGSGVFAALACSFEGTGPEISFRVDGEERRLPDGVELALYRAMQEGLTNALKHSGARHVRTTLSFGVRSAKVTVADDGKGTEPGGGSGFGLASLAARAEELGGTLQAGNTEEGFLLKVEVPS